MEIKIKEGSRFTRIDWEWVTITEEEYQEAIKSSNFFKDMI